MSKILISCITPSVRSEGLQLVERALKNQEFTSYEWIIVAPEKIHEEIEKKITIPYVLLKEPVKNKEDYWAVYKAYNYAISHAKGELLISLQDFTFIKYDIFGRFWTHYQDEPKTLVTGVGNKYTQVLPELGAMVWKDPRIRSDFGTYYKVNPNDIEWNLSSIPKEAVYAVGGFDEELDKYSSCCGLDVADRLSIIGGWEFKIDQTIESYSLVHDRLPNWEENNPFKNGAYKRRLSFYTENGPVLNYLKRNL